MFFAAYNQPVSTLKTASEEPANNNEPCYSAMYFDQICRIGALSRREPDQSSH